jgi:hypothetical protein
MTHEIRFTALAKADLIALHEWIESAAGIDIADAYLGRPMPISGDWKRIATPWRIIRCAVRRVTRCSVESEVLSSNAASSFSTLSRTRRWSSSAC